MLIQTVAMCFALALMALLCCAEGAIFLSRIDVGGFIVQAPEVLVHPYVSCLILLINTVVILWHLWILVSSWYKRRQLLGKVILKLAKRQLVPGQQGVWKDLGRCLGQLSPPIAWEFTPGQAK